LSIFRKPSAALTSREQALKFLPWSSKNTDEGCTK
jgi:hypothetical protein